MLLLAAEYYNCLHLTHTHTHTHTHVYIYIYIYIVRASELEKKFVEREMNR